MAVERVVDPASFEKLQQQFLPLKEWVSMAKSSTLKEKARTGLRGDSEYARRLTDAGVTSHMFSLKSTDHHFHAVVGAIPRQGLLGTSVNGIHILADRNGPAVRIRMLNQQEARPVLTGLILVLSYIALLVPGLIVTASLILARRQSDARAEKTLMPILAETIST